MNPIAFQPYLIEVTFKVPWNERLKTGRYWVILGIQVSYTKQGPLDNSRFRVVLEEEHWHLGQGLHRATKKSIMGPILQTFTYP